MSKYRKLLLAVATFLATALLAYYSLYVAPFSRRTYVYNCRLCARYYKIIHRQYLFFKFTTKSDIQSYERFTSTYENFIGMPHGHEWCGGAYTSNSETILGRGFRHGDGTHTYGPYPSTQRLITYHALKWIRQYFDETPKDVNWRLYRQMINLSSYAEVEDFCKLNVEFMNNWGKSAFVKDDLQ